MNKPQITSNKLSQTIYPLTTWYKVSALTGKSETLLEISSLLTLLIIESLNIPSITSNMPNIFILPKFISYIFK